MNLLFTTCCAINGIPVHSIVEFSPKTPSWSISQWHAARNPRSVIGAAGKPTAAGSAKTTGPTYLAALEQFRKLLALETNKGTDNYLVSALLNQYRAHLKATRKSAVPGIFEVMAKGFSEEFGTRRVCELEPHMLETWLGQQDRWNNTSKAHAGTLILGAVSWARRKGYIKTDPLASRVDLPQPILRGREAHLSEDLMDILISESHANKMRSRDFGEFLWALRLTGARPGELRNAEALNYEKAKDGQGRIIFRWNATRGYIWKNAKKAQRDRVIYLTPELQAHIEKLRS